MLAWILLDQGKHKKHNFEKPAYQTSLQELLQHYERDIQIKAGVQNVVPLREEAGRLYRFRAGWQALQIKG